MTDIERFEEDVRRFFCEGGAYTCPICMYDDEDCDGEHCGCCNDSCNNFKWRGRIAEAVEKIGEDVKPDPVNRPAHYTQGGIECIDAMTAAFGEDAVKNFCLCNCFKYLWRHRNKNGVEDLKKARWYLGRLIAEMEAEEDDG